MKSTNLFNFLILYFIGNLKNWRFKSFRHFEEMENVSFWNKRIQELLETNYDLTVLIVQSYRVKKGYGDTFQKSQSKFKILIDFADEIKKDFNCIATFEEAFKIALNKHEVGALQREIAYIIKNKKEL
jgi:indolepyruvate ferredoxin oxidoreductase beta subunit